MLMKPIKSTDLKLLVQLLTVDPALGQRLARALEATGRFHTDLIVGRVTDLTANTQRAGLASLLVLEVDPRRLGDLATLEHLLRVAPTRPATIILADGLGEEGARRLLRLQVADWLSTSCTEDEFVATCEKSLTTTQPGAITHARCTTFVSALGGAGSSTLCLAASSVLARAGNSGLRGCCVVDLNFQGGVLADYLDLMPNLQLGEIAAAPERLDAQLLKVMLSRHGSGLSMLAAPQFVTGITTTEPDLIARLLNLAEQQFHHLIIDLPRLCPLHSKNVVRGTDALYIVTELTVAGLRQARRLADMLEDSFDVSSKRTVIVNKVSWFANGGLSTGHAREALGNRLAGFVSKCTTLALQAQNRGLLLSQVKKRNRIEAALEQILFSNNAGSGAKVT